MDAMTENRFPFIVDRKGEEAFVAMNCNGLIRSRPMPGECLEDMGTVCKRMHDEVIAVVKQDQQQMNHFPSFPHCIRLADCDMGPCTAVLFGGKAQGGQREFSIAFYDADDDSAPAMLLIEEQIVQFIEQVGELFKKGE